MRTKDFDLEKTLKGSNVYRNSVVCFNTTPSGSHPIGKMYFYKHQIPLGLLMKIMEAYIQKGLAELKELM